MIYKVWIAKSFLSWGYKSDHIILEEKNITAWILVLEQFLQFDWAMLRI